MEQNTNTQKINILNILKVFLSYWPIYVISIFIFLSIGVLFLKVASKKYSVFTSILINTNSQGMYRSPEEYVNVNGMMNEIKTFQNETNFLQSSPFIKEIIEDMNLRTSYYIQEDWIPKELPFSLNNIYKASPFIVIINDKHFQPLNTLFYINIIDENTFNISAYEKKAILYDYENEVAPDYKYIFYLYGTYKFGEIIENEYCSFKILLNSNYDPEYFEGMDLFFKFNSPQFLAYEFQEKFRIDGSSGMVSSIINLTFEWENVDIAMEFLKRLIDKYIEKNLEKKNLNADKTIEYIEQQLLNVQGTLGQSERRLQNFQSSSNAVDINRKSTDLFDQIRTLEIQRNNIQSDYQNLASLRDYIKENINSSTLIIPPSMGMTDQTLTTLIEELSNLSKEKQELINTGQIRNARIQTLDANITNIKKVLLDNLDFSITSKGNELKEINRRLDDLNIEYSKLPQTQRQLIELEREFNLNDAVYSSLLEKRMEAKILKASTRPDAEIIEPVRYNDIVSPSPKIIVLVFLFLGLFFPSTYILFVNFLTPKIKSMDDLSKYCRLPSVGSIPHNDNTELDLIFKYPQLPIVERFHSIRSNINYYHKETNKIIVITSTLPNEGKSFTSLNMALSFASAGKKTLLITFDLRKSSKTFRDLNMSPLAGLDLFLMNRANLEDIILKTTYPNLDFISNGKIQNDPITLMSSPRIPELFDALKYEYDYIIVDTPPFGMVSDAFSLMQYADIKLYVARLGVVTKKALKISMEDIESKNIKDIYLIKNDIPKIDKTYADKYSYQETKKRKFFNFLKPKRL